MPPLPRLALLLDAAAFSLLADLVGTRRARHWWLFQSRLRGGAEPAWAAARHLEHFITAVYSGLVLVVALGVLLVAVIWRQAR